MNAAMSVIRVIRQVGLIFLMILFPAMGRSNPVGEAGSRHIRMRAGETQEISYPLGADLTVSRRGVVDVFHLGDGRWQVTALHAGFVVIDAHDAISGETKWPRLFIDIASIHSEDQLDNPPAGDLPQWLCRDSNVQCQRESGILSGTAKSYVWFAHARETCRSLAGCYFDVNLDPAAYAVWIDDLRQMLGQSYTVLPGAGSVPTVEVYCGRVGREKWRDEVDALTSKAVSEGRIWLRCRDEFSRTPFRLQVRMFSILASDVRALGLDPQIDAHMALPLSNSNANILSRLEAWTRDHRAEVIAEPVLRLTPNQRAEILSGTEFQVVEHVVRSDRQGASSDVSSWKQQGLSLRVSLAPLSSDRVRLSYELTLKTKAEGITSLNVNELKSEIDLVLGTPVMVGILDLRGSGSDSSGIPILEKLPLIGPLFHRNSVEKVNSRLLLWLTVHSDESLSEFPQPPT